MNAPDEAQSEQSSSACSAEGEVPAEDAAIAALRGDYRVQIFNQRLSDAGAEKFPRCIRIVHPSDYRALYKTDSKVYSPHFVLFGRISISGHSRLGITASRKVGGAVVRNRMKRLFREIFRRHNSQISYQLDMVVNVKSGCGGVSYEELRTEFLTAVKKLADRCSG